jgi:O-antigen/teichoic acid export membrane protein
MAFPLIFFGKRLLGLWMGADFANQAHVVLAVLAIAFMILALNIVPHNALLALRHVRFVSTVNILGGILSLFVAAALIPFLGLPGAAIGRLLYGPAVTFNFLKIRSEFSRSIPVPQTSVLIST